MKKITKKEQQRRERIDKKKKLKEWSKQVRERDGNKCVICGSTENLNAHHILPKEGKIFKSLMFDLDNGITLCVSHHKFSYEISPHKNPFVFTIWLHANKLNQFNKLADKFDKIWKEK